MLKLIREPRFAHVVTVKAASGDEPAQTIRAVYRGLHDDEARTFDLTSAEGEKAFLRAVVAEVHDIQDEDGEELRSSPELIEALLGWGYIRYALVNGYFEAQLKARLGN